MNNIDWAILDHLKRPLNGRSYKEIMRRTGLSVKQISGALARLRKHGHLNGWDITEKEKQP